MLRASSTLKAVERPMRASSANRSHEDRMVLSMFGRGRKRKSGCAGRAKGGYAMYMPEVGMFHEGCID